MKTTFALLAALVLTAGCQPPDRDAMTVSVALQHETPSVAKATVVVDYSRAGAKILAEEGGPACAFIMPGVGGTFADDGRGALTVHVQSKRGLRGPADLVACRMLAAKSDTTSGDIRQRLDVKLTEAEDGAGKVIDLASLTTSKAVRAPAVAAPESPEAPVAEATKAGEMQAGMEARKAHAKSDGTATTAPVPPATPAVVPPRVPTPPVPAARPPAPPPSKPAGGPASANLGRSVINNPNPALSKAQQQRAGDINNGGSNNQNSSPGGLSNNNDDNFDDSPSDDPSAPAYEVTAGVTRSVGRLGALQFEIAFQGDSGGWAERGANVICEVLTDGLAASNNPGGREVKIGVVSLQGFNTPNDIVKCIFRSHDSVSTRDFVINVTDASNINTEPLPSIPQMSVTRVTRI